MTKLAKLYFFMRRYKPVADTDSYSQYGKSGHKYYCESGCVEPEVRADECLMPMTP